MAITSDFGLRLIVFPPYISEDLQISFLCNPIRPIINKTKPREEKLKTERTATGLTDGR